MKLLTGAVALLLGSMLVSGQAGSPQAPGADPSAPATAAQRGAGGGRGGRGGTPRVVFIPDAPVLDYALVQNPLPLPDGTAYGVVASVGVNSGGHAFVYHRSPVPIAEFDDKGTFVRGWRAGTDTRAHSLRFDAADNMWLVDSGAHTVTKVSPRGDVLMTLGTSGVSGSGPDEAARPLFNIPSDIAIAPNGDIFVAQGEAGGPDPRVIRFDRTGKFLATWSLAFSQGVRSNPHALAVDRNGLIYVADREVMRIRVFSPDGTPVRDIQMKNLVCGLFIDSANQLWVAAGTDGMILKVDWDGQVQGRMGTGGRGAGQIGEGHMLTVTPAGDIFLADSVNRVVHKFAKR